MSEALTKSRGGHAEHMDRMYRYTRHVYDASRRYFLIGRDRLLKMMNVKAGARVLEMGCGTARNLIKLHRLHPDAELFGLDASESMLDTAETALAARNLSGKVMLRHCLAEQMTAAGTFGLAEPFDVIFFSYSLSMMPTWPQAIDAALANLKSDGRIHIVDFWDQAELPRWFAGLLKRWLSLFHVHHRPELLEHLRKLEGEGKLAMELESIGGRYAYIASIVPATK